MICWDQVSEHSGSILSLAAHCAGALVLAEVDVFTLIHVLLTVVTSIVLRALTAVGTHIVLCRDGQ